jgi:phosphoglycerate kinase
VAGAGDTVAAEPQVKSSATLASFSAAGGAFLEWMEGRALPGVEALRI